MKGGYHLWIVLFGIVVSAVLLQQLIANTVQKEGFKDTNMDVEVEDRVTPEAFSYNILQVVKGPIRRLSTQLMDISSWKERWDLAQLSPVELARRNLSAQ